MEADGASVEQKWKRPTTKKGLFPSCPSKFRTSAPKVALWSSKEDAPRGHILPTDRPPAAEAAAFHKGSNGGGRGKRVGERKKKEEEELNKKMPIANGTKRNAKRLHCQIFFSYFISRAYFATLLMEKGCRQKKRKGRERNQRVSQLSPSDLVSH